MQTPEGLTRRGVLTLVASAGFARLYAFSSDFWNKKEPADWSSDEVNQLTTKSPWAKEVSAQMQGTGMGQGGGMGGGGPMGGGPMGGGGMGGGMSGGMGRMGGGRRGGGGMTQNYRGTVRWESAKVVLDATKTPLPEAFSNHYVISVSGIPLNAGGRRRSQSQDDDSNTNSDADLLERLKGVTYLEPKNKRDIQPGIVQEQPSSYGSVLFGFSKEMLTIKPEDKEVTFTTQFGRLSLKTKFILKDMLYHGELAV